MFVPLHDENSLKSIRFQWVTILLIAINVIVYFLETARFDEVAIAGFAIVPKELFDTSLLPIPVESVGPQVSERLTLLTYMFFHGDILHLAGNMLFLWVFGDNVEDALGHLKFALFYVACGIAGAMAHALLLPGSPQPLIGASGAVAGVIVAYLILYPHVRVWVLAMRFIPLRITALFALGAWVASQFAMLAIPYIVPGANIGPISWWAHIGGIAAGAVLVFVMRRVDPAGSRVVR